MEDARRLVGERDKVTVELSRVAPRSVEEAKGLVCEKCQEVPRKTYRFSSCGHRFCSECLTAMERGDGNYLCVVDGKQLTGGKSAVVEDSDWTNQVNALHVICSYGPNGCRETHQLRYLQSHENSCKYRPAHCEHAGCGSTHPICQLADHMRECSFQESQCEQCGQKMPLRQMQEHLTSNCRRVILFCPQQCGEKLPRQELAQHIADRCTLTPVKCPFYSIGDGCPEKPERRMLQKHLGLAVSQHQQLLLQANLQLQHEEVQLCLELRDVQDRLQSMRTESASSLQNRWCMCQKQNSLNADKLQSFQTMVTTQQERLDILERNVSLLSKQFEQLQALVEGKDSESANNTTEVATLRREMKQLQQAVRSLAAQSSSEATSLLRWKVSVCLQPDGRLTLKRPVTESFYTGPAQLGCHIGLDVKVIPLVALSSVVATHQVGAVHVTPTFLPGQHDLDLSWPLAHHIILSFPNPLSGSTLSRTALAQLARPLPQQVAGDPAARSPICTGVIPLLLPPDAELGASISWTYEITLNFGWQSEK